MGTYGMSHDALHSEDEIVWLEDVSQQPYVREIFVYRSNRAGRMRYSGAGRAVG
jgi:Family of unknown function (DUF6009)